MAKVFRKLNSLIKKNDIVIPIILLLLAIFLVVCMYSGGKTIVEGFDLFGMNDPSSAESGGGDKKKVVFYHMEGCPHCVKMMPEWDKFKSSNTNVDALDIEAKEIGGNPMLSQHAEKYVKGFPTILALSSDGNKVIEVYKGERTSNGITTFVNNL